MGRLRLKPVVFVCNDGADCRAIAEAAALVAGGMDRLRLNPTLLLYSEPTTPLQQSRTAVGELRGREKPDEVVVIGGHLDSWDVGAGASDDGGGCVAVWEALRLMKKLDLRPRRTVRVVLFTNEENGGRGGLAYRAAHAKELAAHVMMLEADYGLFQPVSFGVNGSLKAQETVTAIASLLQEIGVDHVTPAGGGSDIDPSVQAGHIPALSYDGSGDYFRYHHTQADTVDKIEAADVSRAAAAIAVMTYVVADLPARLGEDVRP